MKTLRFEYLGMSVNVMDADPESNEVFKAAYMAFLAPNMLAIEMGKLSDEQVLELFAKA